MFNPQYYTMLSDDGSPVESILPIQGSNGYTISNTGVIRNSKGAVVKHHTISSGYAIVTFITASGCRCTRLVHALVAEAFLQAPDGCFKYVVHHVDGNRSNNAVGNLQYTTYSDNLKAAYNVNACVEVEEYLAGLGGEVECQLVEDVKAGVLIKDLMQQYSITRSMAVKLRRYFNVKTR